MMWMNKAIPLWMMATVLIAPLAAQTSTPPNSLSGKESQQGWKLLFDGRTLEGWRGFGKDQVPAAWKVEGGALAFAAQGEGGDLMTEEEFADFELHLEWKISAGGNSGIFFRVSQDRDWSFQTGAEMQILDNSAHADGGNPKTSSGSNYALHAPASDVTRPVGEWNSLRIVARGDHVEHWMNGVKLLEYQLWDEQWEELVRNSKFASMPGYGRNKKGHIVLQDHGNKVWYRSIKIRTF
ncbi:MAG: DUF1080 domain-containing protein [Acidobacteriota bacterium]